MEEGNRGATKDETNEYCYLRVSVAGNAAPLPIVIKLSTGCAQTCRNFLALCSSTETTSRHRPVPSYRGCEFHRIVDNFMVQAGDFERFDGTGGYSPISGGTFADENLVGRHDQAGVVSMANKGKNTNGSQFFITLQSTPHLDGKHVVFGQVVSGMESVEQMLTVERDGDRPVRLQRIVITDCGVGKGDEPLEGSGAKDEAQRRHRRKKSKKRKDYSSDSSSTQESRERRRKRSRKRHEDDSTSSGTSSYERRRRKKKKHGKKEDRHRKKHKRR